MSFEEIKRKQAKLRELDTKICHLEGRVDQVVKSMGTILGKTTDPQHIKKRQELLSTDIYEPTDEELNGFSPEKLNIYCRWLDNNIAKCENMLKTLKFQL